jgi:hypothetical protein
MSSVNCRCGAIVLAVHGRPIAQVYCHCGDCQLAHGAAYVPNIVYPAEAIAVTKGMPAAFAVKAAPRHYCSDCGTLLFTQVQGVPLVSLNAYLFGRLSFAPEAHLHCADAVMPVVDNLPHYIDLPEEFGGTGRTAAW